jgi:maspardin
MNFFGTEKVGSKNEDFLRFRGFVGTQKVEIDEMVWKFYDWGPKTANPIVFLHGLSETAEVFYHQFLSLAVKGYRIVSVQIPPYEEYNALLQGLELFFEYLEVLTLHLFGAGLGGYIALCYISKHQKRVASLILCNSFCSLRHFQKEALPAVKWLPGFYLKQQLCKQLPDWELEHRIADSIDFIVSQIDTLTQEDIAYRMILLASSNFFSLQEDFPFDQSKITIIDTLDNTACKEPVREELYRFFPLATQATLKSGMLFNSTVCISFYWSFFFFFSISNYCCCSILTVRWYFSVSVAP